MRAVLLCINDHTILRASHIAHQALTFPHHASEPHQASNFVVRRARPRRARARARQLLRAHAIARLLHAASGISREEKRRAHYGSRLSGLGRHLVLGLLHAAQNGMAVPDRAKIMRHRVCGRTEAAFAIGVAISTWARMSSANSILASSVMTQSFNVMAVLFINSPATSIVHSKRSI